MLTGVIYGAIVVVWAAYLVPLALRRHDEASRTRSIARFSSAMRVLARRGSTDRPVPAPSARRVVTPPRDRQVITPESAAGAVRMPVGPRPDRAAERAAAARRRSVLQILGAVTLLVAVLVLLGFVPKWSIALPVLAIVGFLVVARRQVRLANEVYWAAVAVAPEESSAVVVRRSAVRVEASHSTDDDEPTVTLTQADRRQTAAIVTEEEHMVAVSLQTPEGGSLWDPLPVTLPTYVDAAVAKRTFRTIELGEPGTWTSGHAKPDSQATAATSAPAEAPAAETSAPDEEGDEDVARAVNG